MTILRKRVSILLIIFLIGPPGNGNGDEELSCYQCNTDLGGNDKELCNDPYIPAPPGDLIACPRNESYHCLKSLILYKNVHVTVRGCLPTRAKETYCDSHQAFPEASVECHFCNTYACNSSPSIPTSSTHRFMIFSSLIPLVFASGINLHR